MAEPTPTTPEADVAYADAMAELNSILGALEDDNIDIDVLASKVERASQLIVLCRDRINAAKVQVEEVVATLDAPSDEAASTDTSE